MHISVSHRQPPTEALLEPDRLIRQIQGLHDHRAVLIAGLRQRRLRAPQPVIPFDSARLGGLDRHQHRRLTSSLIAPADRHEPAAVDQRVQMSGARLDVEVIVLKHRRQIYILGRIPAPEIEALLQHIHDRARPTHHRVDQVRQILRCRDPQILGRSLRLVRLRLLEVLRSHSRELAPQQRGRGLLSLRQRERRQGNRWNIHPITAFRTRRCSPALLRRFEDAPNSARVVAIAGALRTDFFKSKVHVVPSRPYRFTAPARESPSWS